jgi:hypothetical protein
MADAEKKGSFPSIPTPHWWTLRKKFKQSIPGVVTDNYVASVLNMQLNSAQANVMPALRAAKIIDRDGKPLERAKRWRDDEAYPAVCEEIRKDIYPDDLLHAISDPVKNRTAAERWFANHTGAGTAAVSKMATFYALLTEADPKNAPQETSSSEKGKPKQLAARPQRKVDPVAVRRASTAARGVNAESAGKEKSDGGDRGPAVYINLQVHISADASTDQIDQVFASMAKHIYKGSE